MGSGSIAGGRLAGDIQLTTLDNGARVITDRMEGVASASIGAWFGVGTRNESSEANGVAHLLEHMAFKGTKRRSPAAIAEEIEAVGGHLNAYTSREQTAYYARVLGQDAELAVDLISDILVNSTFDETELARERSVILQEIGQAEDTPDDIIFDNFQEAAFPSQPIGRPVLGRSEIIRDMGRGVVTDFIGRNYAGETMVFAAAGDVEHERLVDAVASGFDRLPAKASVETERAHYAGGEFREDRDLEQVHFILGFRGVPFNDPDFHAIQMLSMVLGGGMSSRLFQEVREKRGLVYSVYSFTASYLDDGLFGIYAGTGEEEIAEVVDVTTDTLGQIAETLSDEEIDRARTQLRAGLLMSRESTYARCEQAAQHLHVYGRVVPTEETLEKLESVDRAAIARALSRLFEARPTVAGMGPLAKLETADGITKRLF